MRSQLSMLRRIRISVARVALAQGAFFAAVLLVSLASSRARAEWQYRAAPGCLDEAAARAEVERTLGAPLDGDLRVTVEIGGVPGSWSASIAVEAPHDARREREIASEARDCRALDPAIVVVLALLADEVRRPASPSPLSIEVPSSIEESHERGWRGAVRVGASVRIGELPGLAAAVGLEGEVEPPGVFPFVLGVLFFPPVETLQGAIGGRFIGAGVVAGGCPAVSWDAIEIGGCLVASATYVAAEGVGISAPARADGLSFGVGLAAFARVRVAGALWVRLAAGALVPIVRATATFEDGGRTVLVHEPFPIVPEAALALELRLGGDR